MNFKLPLVQRIAKRRRLQLDPVSYKKLQRAVLKRDGWRCQQCGVRDKLHVHHIQPRSLMGDDAESNLITLCASCHEKIHRSVMGRSHPSQKAKREDLFCS